MTQTPSTPSGHDPLQPLARCCRRTMQPGLVAIAPHASPHAERNRQLWARLKGQDECGGIREVNRQRDGAGDGVGDQHRGDAKHCEPAILQLAQPLALQLLGAHFAGETNGIPEALEALEGSRRAALLHVVRLDLPFALVLDDANRGDDLLLAQRRQRAPLLQRRQLAEVLQLVS